METLVHASPIYSPLPRHIDFKIGWVDPISIMFCWCILDKWTPLSLIFSSMNWKTLGPVFWGYLTHHDSCSIVLCHCQQFVSDNEYFQWKCQCYTFICLASLWDHLLPPLNKEHTSNSGREFDFLHLKVNSKLAVVTHPSNPHRRGWDKNIIVCVRPAWATEWA